MKPALLLAAVLVVLAAPPASADTVLTLLNHTDEIKMMGRTTPAQTVTNEYWFGERATRYDSGETSVLMRVDLKKLFFVDHAEKTVSTLDLPFDFKSLVSPEMAPMMEQMSKMMQATTTVTPSDRTGSFGGYACKYSRIDISLAMMKMEMDSCLSPDVPIDYERYKELSEAQAELIPNADWMKDVAEKMKGFPVRSDTTTTMMGKSYKGWQELQKVDQRTPPPGHYDPPADYREKKFDPMAEMQQGRGRGR